jgi:outer membrane receptor protein involved in Fe transport
MKKIILTTMLICLISQVIFPQAPTATVTGKITNEKNEPLVNVTVKVKNGKQGTLTDEQGKFSLTVASLPVLLEITSIEYSPEEINVSSAGEVSVILQSYQKILDPVVIGANKKEGKMTIQAVSIERVGKADIINSPTDPYGALLPKKGLDVTVSSITYKTYSTRGFNGSGSSRVNQLMDGMDNQAPGLNFSVGNFVGLTDLDIESIEILPGASSALYGPGGMNGTIILNSKSPFSKNNSGLSLLVKNGLTDVGKKQRDKIGGYYDYTLRWAKNFNDKFAFKIGAQYVQANDWLANDSTNYLRIGTSGHVTSGNRQTDPNYDGVNVYGDETKVDIRAFMNSSPQLQTIFAKYLTSTQNVSRTGYNEINLIDPKTKNIKLTGALHYKFNKNVEAILAGHWAKGNTVYTGNNRYALKDIKLGQYKIELKHKNWFLRGYTTQEDAGEAYSATVTAQYLNEAWKRSFDPSNINGSWYPQYFGAFATGGAQIFQSVLMNGGTVAQAQDAVYAAASQLHTAGRSYADRDRPAANSTQFKQYFDQVRKIPIPNGGLFVEKSQLWMGEGQYDFSDKIKFADIIVGGNVKKYILSSKGTLFIDTAGAIKINEWGAYAQISKKIFNEKLVLSASGRYDKNENFEGKFTPRLTALIKVAEGHNIRLSYQTAYKFPTTQQQWIRLNIGDAILLGGLPWIVTTLQPEKYPTFVYNNGQTIPWTYNRMKPESMRSFEIGYKSYINKKLLIDAYAYFGKYTDFLGRIVLVQPTRQSTPWSIVTNSDTEIKTWGAGIGFDYKMEKNFFSFFNAYTDNLTDVPAGFQAGFSTPKYRLNAGLGNSGLGKKERIGFNINLRWQDDFYWESGGLADGTVKAYTTLDAQVNYKLPKIKSMIKLGGTNITNKYYQTGFGNPYIGGMYYLSFAYNIL